MNWKITKHAKLRLKERNLPLPHNLQFTRLTRSMRKKLKQSCGPKGLHKNYVYFVYSKHSIYVAAPQDINSYMLITVLKY